MKEEWKEGQDRTIALPDDSADVVSLHVDWVYSNRILSRTSSPSNENDSGEIQLLVHAFVFGEKIQDGRFKDALIDAMIKSTLHRDKDGMRWFPGVSTVNIAYEGTPPGSPLRRLMIDLWARNGGEKWARSGLDSAFLIDLVGELFVNQKSHFGSHPTDGGTSTCSHHQHGEDHLCYSSWSGS